MAKTLEEWDKLAIAKFLEFAENPDCKRCPLGFDEFNDTIFRPYQQLIEKKYERDSCVCCPHILGTVAHIYDASCPCHLYTKAEAFGLLEEWRKKQ